MLTYQQISKYKKYVKVDDHAVDRYHSRFCNDYPPDKVRWKLKNAYIRGDQLHMKDVTVRVKRFLKHHGSASYYKYGNIVVVVQEEGPRYEPYQKTILTCYPFKDSQFDEKSLLLRE